MPCNCDGMTTLEDDLAKKIRTEIAEQYPSTERYHLGNYIEDVCRICRFFEKDALNNIKVSYGPGLLKWYEMHLVQDIEFNKKELARVSGEPLKWSKW